MYSKAIYLNCGVHRLNECKLLCNSFNVDFYRLHEIKSNENFKERNDKLTPSSKGFQSEVRVQKQLVLSGCYSYYA